MLDLAELTLIEAQAQNHSEVLKKCRASVAYPIVHPCMVSNVHRRYHTIRLPHFLRFNIARAVVAKSPAKCLLSRLMARR
jgi:hypothetical protein